MFGAIALGSCNFSDGDIKAPAIDHSTFIAGPSGASLSAKAAAPIKGGGFILAGVSSYGGWAAKVDSRGDLAWFYNRPILPAEKWKPGDAQPPMLSPSLQYTGIAQMSDGTTFLCGSITRQSDETQRALLTHLNANGKVLADFVLPQSSASPATVYSVGNCVSAGNAIIVFAGVLEQLASNFFYFSVSENGELKWQKTFAPIPPVARQSDENATSTHGNRLPLTTWASSMAVQSNTDSKSIFILTKDGSHSELDTINQDGSILARRALDGDVYLLHSADNSKDASIYDPPSGSAHTSNITQYDYHLHVLHRSSVDPMTLGSFKYILDGFVQPDNSFVFLGGVRNGLGLAVPAGIAVVDQGFRHEKHIKLQPNGSALGLPTEFAVATSVRGQYLVAVPVARPETWIHAPGDPHKVTPGLALYFINAS